MKVILQNAITVNGFIAGPENNTDWVSKEDWDSFIALAKKIGVMIIGRNTYQLMKNAGEISSFSNILIVVLTRNKRLVKENNNLLIVNKSPKEIIKMLTSMGFRSALIAGGGKTNSSFLKQNLIDEVYLDIHPQISSRGTHLFNDGGSNMKLKLMNTKKLSDNVLQMHYKILAK